MKVPNVINSLKAKQLMGRMSLALLLITFTFVSCNPTRDRWVNRKWHTLTGHFNIYFNGEQKLNDAVAQLELANPNDFTKTLDVFPLGTPEAAKGVGNVLDDAIKKFSGTVQFHTIGSYTDDAWYGVARCQYYKRDYYAALESFQYVNAKYKNSPFKIRCESWVARCYVGLNKYGEAEAIMGLLLNEKNLQKTDIYEVYSTAADVDIRIGKYTSAIDHLNKALTGNLTKEKKIRYHFILGQLCMNANKKPEAIFHFNKVLSLLPSYDFAFNANINLTKIYDPNDKRAVARVRRSLKSMANDDKNKDYLDQIYFELGRLELSQKNYPEAVTNFKKSISKSTKNVNQKALSYYELAKLYFSTKDYKSAQSYYDSTVSVLDPKYKDFDQIKSTQMVLKELISNLLVFEAEDSLQKLVLLSKDALERKVTSWIAADNAQKLLDAKMKKKNEQVQATLQSNQPIPFGGITNAIPGAGSGAWYFYNPPLIAEGAADFASGKKWGQRQNEDYWRIAAKEKPKSTISPTNDANGDKKTGSNTTDSSTSNVQEIAPAPIKEVLTGDAAKDSWIKNVPFTNDKMNRSKDRMKEALHNLGVIYYDKLKNPTESIHYMEELEKRFPQSDYEPEALYYLFKTSKDIEKKDKAEVHKNTLITKYPESPYTYLVQNKPLRSAENENNKALLKEYESMLMMYQSGQWGQAKEMRGTLDKKYPGNTLKPKYDYLYALCVGKTDSLGSFRNALEDIVRTYPNLDVGESAKYTLDLLNKEQKRATLLGKDTSQELEVFDIETETPCYYIFAVKNNKADFTEFVSKFAAYNQDYASNDNLRVNAMMSNEGYQLLVIREFKNFKHGEDYLEGVAAVNLVSKQLKLEDPFVQYIISVKNFKEVLKNKRVEQYLPFYRKLVENLKKQQ